MPWVKGKSGNPGGRKKLPDDIRASAKLLTPEALATQADIMRDPLAPAQARISAAENIINRAYGKPEATTNLMIGAGAAFIDILRLVNDRTEIGTVANGVAEQPEQPAAVRH